MKFSFLDRGVCIYKGEEREREKEGSSCGFEKQTKTRHCFPATNEVQILRNERLLHSPSSLFFWTELPWGSSSWKGRLVHSSSTSLKFWLLWSEQLLYVDDVEIFEEKKKKRERRGYSREQKKSVTRRKETDKGGKPPHRRIDITLYSPLSRSSTFRSHFTIRIFEIVRVIFFTIIHSSDVLLVFIILQIISSN